ncbi:MAG: SEC-C domain-containing protein [Acidobacteria bacterium]|nr:SEC-C domain-containing protein [Acidobacteriota bacterium]
MTAAADPPNTPTRPESSKEQPGRNDRCWCESGVKYKSCHYRFDRA